VKIRESDELFRLLVSTIKDYAILMLDPEGRVTSWNAGAERIKGYRAEEIIGQHFSRFYPAEDVAQGKPEHELKVAAEQGRFEDEGWRLRKDGSRFWANVVITAVRDGEGQLLGFGKVTRDMTERRQTEEALRVAKENAEALSAELEAFCHSVSHDLRAPLRSIDGFSRILLEEYADKLDSTGQEYLRRACAGSQRMSDLIDDLLRLSRITRAEISRQPVDLSALAREIAAELHAEQPDRAVEWKIAEGLVAEGDARLLRLALKHLLDNAWKFTAARAPAAIELGVSEQDGERVYFVRDDGVGFDMAYADKLFGVFQRLHATEEFEGTGIGLATVQRIVRRHGGRVWAEGATEKGATFYFTLNTGGNP
jgi:PAS domain S-box-containing protein